MLAINVFVLPIAFGGLLTFDQGGVDADSFVLTLPMSRHMEALTPSCSWAGSRGDGMVIVRPSRFHDGVQRPHPAAHAALARRLAQRPDLPQLLLNIRRGAIVVILLLGYFYFVAAGEAYALVSIGLVFAAVAQFAPALLGASTGRAPRATAHSRGSRAVSRCGSTRCCFPPSRSRGGSAWKS
jgi:hypothetical protein